MSENKVPSEKFCTHVLKGAAMGLWTVFVKAKGQASVVSRKWVAAESESEAREMATRDSRSETGEVLLAKEHHSESVSMTDQWAIADLKAIAAKL
jgi:hypothetical protein